MELREIESAIEAILFAVGDPVPLERLCLTIGADRNTVESVCKKLADTYSYERRGIRLLRLDSSYQLCSAPECAEYVRHALEGHRPAKLSQPALEVLAVVAYYQPTTRAYVDQVRGVDSSYTMSVLQERELIEECGRLSVPGRPLLYRTTKTFLRTFGLSHLDELPELPATDMEEGQVTIEMQTAIARLQAEQQGDESLSKAGSTEA